MRSSAQDISLSMFFFPLLQYFIPRITHPALLILHSVLLQKDVDYIEPVLVD